LSTGSSPKAAGVDVIGVQEFSSIAGGIVAMDAMVKAAPVRVVAATTVCPGKLVIVITGDEASVEYALDEGRRRGAPDVVDELYIANLHPGVIPAIAAAQHSGELDALGVVECLTVTASIRVADLAAKEAAVRIVRVRLSGEMGGKSTVKLTGPIHEVEAAMAAGVRWVEERGLLCRQVVLPRPHPEIRDFLLDVPRDGGTAWI
jgi:microcompartment protein CcmL/EutN